MKAAAAILLLLSACEPAEISGFARVVDGDTLAFGTTRVRIWGMDAPEARQLCGAIACGAEATRQLRSLVSGHEVSCQRRGDDQYGRVLATCRVSPARTDLAYWMIRRGFAYATESPYQAIQLEAAREFRGFWAEGFQSPRAFRKEHPR